MRWYCAWTTENQVKTHIKGSMKREIESVSIWAIECGSSTFFISFAGNAGKTKKLYKQRNTRSLETFSLSFISCTCLLKMCFQSVIYVPHSDIVLRTLNLVLAVLPSFTFHVQSLFQLASLVHAFYQQILILMLLPPRIILCCAYQMRHLTFASNSE